MAMTLDSAQSLVHRWLKQYDDDYCIALTKRWNAQGGMSEKEVRSFIADALADLETIAQRDVEASRIALESAMLTRREWAVAQCCIQHGRNICDECGDEDGWRDMTAAERAQ